MTRESADEVTPQDLTGQETSRALGRAVAALCDLKLDLDRYGRDFIGQPFLDDWIGASNSCAYFGDCLLRVVLPFMDWEDESSSYFKAYVNPRHVLGASIKGLPEHIEPGQVDERIARYAGDFGSTDNACYIWVKPLGIFWAHEGKHRVAFMRAHNQPAIAAWVREAGYPSADRLALVRPTDERDEWLTLLDGRYLQVLRRPRVARLLLEAYGVKTLRWSEIPDAPQEHAVRHAMYRQRLHLTPRTTAECERTLDLAVLRKQEQADKRIVARTVQGLAPHRFAWRRFVFCVAGPFVPGLVLSAYGQDAARDVGFLLLGTSLGLFSSLNVIRLFSPKRRDAPDT